MATGKFNEGQPNKKEARARKPQKTQTPNSIVARDLKCMSVKCDFVSREVKKGLMTSSAYVKDQDACTAVYEQSFKVIGYGNQSGEQESERKKGQIMITIEARDDFPAQESIEKTLQELGDGLIDTYTALLIISVHQNGVGNIHATFEVNADDILEVCGKEKSGGSYLPWQRESVTRHLKALSQIYVKVVFPAYELQARKGRSIKVPATVQAEGPIMETPQVQDSII